jgi:hypothetical protein
VDASGAFSLDVPEGEALLLLYESYGTGREGLPFRAALPAVAPGASDVRLAASDEARTATLRVLVRHPSGEPCAHERVAVRMVEVTNRHAGVPATVLQATTDAEGRASFAGVEAWLHHVSVGDVVGGSFCRIAVTRFADGVASEVRLPAPPARVAGRVVFRSGQPARGATVSMTSGLDALGSARTDDAGRFAITGAEEGRVVHLHAIDRRNTARGYVQGVVAGGPDVTIDLEEIGPLWASRAASATSSR